MRFVRTERGTFAAGLITLALLVTACSSTPPAQPTATAAPTAPSARATTIGAANAPVTIVEYGDYL